MNLRRNADPETEYVRFDRHRVIRILERIAADLDQLPQGKQTEVASDALNEHKRRLAELPKVQRRLSTREARNTLRAEINLPPTFALQIPQNQMQDGRFGPSSPFNATSEPLSAPQASSDDQLIDLWVHNRPAETIQTYRADLLRFRTWLGKSGAGTRLGQVTLADLTDFWNALGSLAPATRNRILSSVGLCFRLANGWGIWRSTSAGRSGCRLCPTNWPPGFCRKRTCTGCWRSKRMPGTG
ncbi:MAG TPA: site-specific integrase, partial [Bryobacteraceae bacterium]|nr:site-specific integrase [Bryobacteraceae bacterium]